jgi:hypothetical protein
MAQGILAKEIMIKKYESAERILEGYNEKQQSDKNSKNTI